MLTILVHGEVSSQPVSLLVLTIVFKDFIPKQFLGMIMNVWNGALMQPLPLPTVRLQALDEKWLKVSLVF